MTEKREGFQETERKIKVTNYEKIRDMSAEEMAEFIVSVADRGVEAQCGDAGKECRLWLENQAEGSRKSTGRNLSLEETGREYVRQAQELFRQAEKSRAVMRTAKNGRELLRLREHREKLTEIARDLKITGESLIHYYDR